VIDRFATVGAMLIFASDHSARRDVIRLGIVSWTIRFTKAALRANFSRQPPARQTRGAGFSPTEALGARFHHICVEKGQGLFAPPVYRRLQLGAGIGGAAQHGWWGVVSSLLTGLPD